MAFTAHPATNWSGLSRWPTRVVSSIRRLGPRSPRRTWQLVLAALWLLDAALQYQPYMFTKEFVNGTLAPAAQGNPAAVATPMTWVLHLLSGHPVLFNALFATVQLLIAAGLMWRRTVKLALGASIIWAVGVWWFGEGLGGILTGASPIMGAPGAVILYALLAALVWPRPHSTPPGDRRAASVAESGPLGVTGARLAWVALWGGQAALFLLPANRAPSALHDMLAGAAAGEPGWLAGTEHHLAALVAGHGTAVSIVLAVLCEAVVLTVFVPRLRRTGTAVAIAIGALIWVGQAFGGILTSQGTDPNSGLLLAVVAATFWPTLRPEQAAVVDPAGQRATASSASALRASRRRLTGWTSAPSWRRRNGIAGVAAAVTLAVTGCAAAQPTASSSHAAPVNTMSGMSMGPSMSMNPGASTPAATSANAIQESAPGPSQSARMVCGSEIRGDVAAALDLHSPPGTTASWADHLYTCTYHLPAGTLVLAVKELPDVSVARQYFAAAQANLGRTQPITGLASLGLPAFAAPDGKVMFLKDDKTLEVDAAGLPAHISSFHATRSDFAYQIATDVLGCWTGK